MTLNAQFNLTCALQIARLTFRELWSVKLEWIAFGCVHNKLFSLNRIVGTSRLQTCNRPRFDSFCSLSGPYVVRSSLRSAITGTAELLIAAADNSTHQWLCYK